MNPNAIEQVRAIASGVFFAFPEEESTGAPPEALDDWDSMQRLNLVLALEEHFGIEFATGDIENMTTLAGCAAIVQRKCS